MIDLVALAILVLFTLLGAFRGALSSALRVGSLVLAYLAAFLGGAHVGPLVAQRWEVPSILGTAAGAVLTFVLAYMLLGILSKIVLSIARRRRRRLRIARSRLDRLGGAVLGAAQGGVIVLLLGLLLSYLEALEHTPAAISLPGVSPAESSKLVELSQTVAEQGAEVAFGNTDAAGRMAVQFISRPAQTVEGIQKIVTNPRIEALQRDRLFWSHIENGAIDQALNRASFLGIAYDATLRGQLADLGMVSSAGREDPRLFRNSAKDILKQVGPRLRRLKNDPEFKALARDPAIGEALASGNTLALFQDPRFRSVVNRALEGTAPAN
jgi:uncharacterized membrane protein required for colicin V production